MAQLMRIEGRADKVFKIIKNVCQTSPYVTLAEVEKNGLLEPNLQNSKPYKMKKFPKVILGTRIGYN
jgi:hypothetical protein